MSFIKKGLKKAWEFVKKYWKEIVMVAAVVFTAGIATVGFAGFAAASAAAGGGVTGFFSAVGSTMWAGVTATAGSMGIGSGANVGAGSAFAGAAQGSALGAAQAAGATHVGLGAAAGAGGGFGFGAAGEAAAAEAAAASAAEATALQTAAVEVPGAVSTAPGATGGEVGASMGEALTSGHGAIEKTAAEIAKQRVVADAAGAAVSKAGMSTAEAMLWSTGLSTVGQGIYGYAQGKAMEEDKALSAWGVPISGKQAKGYDYDQHIPDYLKVEGPAAPTPGLMADATQAESMASVQAPVPDAPGQVGGYRGTRAQAARGLMT